MKKLVEQDAFEKIFYFFSENGYTRQLYPDSWDKSKERKAIILLEKNQEKKGLDLTDCIYCHIRTQEKNNG